MRTNSKKVDILCVGSITIDVFGAAKEIKDNESSTLLSKLNRSFGGRGSNFMMFSKAFDMNTLCLSARLDTTSNHRDMPSTFLMLWLIHPAFSSARTFLLLRYLHFISSLTAEIFCTVCFPARSAQHTINMP